VQVNNRGLVDADLAKEALASYGVDELGLDHLGREILEALITRFNGGPVGLGALSSSIGETPSTIEQVYEPYLLRKGLLVRTPRGRMATEKAYAHIGKRMPKDRQLLAVDLGYQQETLLTDLKDEDD
jgi:Holliday junction DNA helicase RuvB